MFALTLTPVRICPFILYKWGRWAPKTKHLTRTKHFTDDTSFKFTDSLHHFQNSLFKLCNGLLFLYCICVHVVYVTFVTYHSYTMETDKENSFAKYEIQNEVSWYSCVLCKCAQRDMVEFGYSYLDRSSLSLPLPLSLSSRCASDVYARICIRPTGHVTGHVGLPILWSLRRGPVRFAQRLARLSCRITLSAVNNAQECVRLVSMEN